MATPVAAADDGLVDLEAVVDEYNDNVAQAPGIVQSMASEEVIELRVGEGETPPASDGGEGHWMEVDADGVISDFETGTHDDPTLRVLIQNQGEYLTL